MQGKKQRILISFSSIICCQQQTTFRNVLVYTMSKLFYFFFNSCRQDSFTVTHLSRQSCSSNSDADQKLEEIKNKSNISIAIVLPLTAHQAMPFQTGKSLACKVFYPI